MQETEELTPQVKYKITDNQVALAQWMALPDGLRVPSTQTELAEIMGVHPSRLTHWKHDEGLTKYLKELLHDAGLNLVPLAIQTLRENLKSPDSRVRQQAAKDILDRWGETKESNTVNNIKDLWDKYNKEKDDKKKGATTLKELTTGNTVVVDPSEIPALSQEETEEIPTGTEM